MTPEVLYALLERVHGHLGWLGLAVLLHPVITVRPQRGVSWRMLLSAYLGAGLLVAPFVLGLWVYPEYRAEVKPGLLRAQPFVGELFEVKEHLAFFAMVLAVGGATALRAGHRSVQGRQLARLMLALAWLCGAAVGLAGIWVSSHAHPGF